MHFSRVPNKFLNECGHYYWETIREIKKRWVSHKASGIWERQRDRNIASSTKTQGKADDKRVLAVFAWRTQYTTSRGMMPGYLPKTESIYKLRTPASPSAAVASASGLVYMPPYPLPTLHAATECCAGMKSSPNSQLWARTQYECTSQMRAMPVRGNFQDMHRAATLPCSGVRPHA